MGILLGIIILTITVALIMLCIDGYELISERNKKKGRWPVWELQGNWEVIIFDDFDQYYVTKYSLYEIYRLDSGNYVLKYYGYKPKEHANYIRAVEKLNELNNSSIGDKQIDNHL